MLCTLSALSGDALFQRPCVHRMHGHSSEKIAKRKEGKIGCSVVVN